jgi:hypothetical protein
MAPSRTLIRIEPEAWIAWGTDDGVVIAQLFRQYFEVPSNGFFIGQWTDKPELEAVMEAANFIRGL